MSYRLIDATMGLPPKYVLEEATGKVIPLSHENTDCQRYLAWLAEGNEVLPPSPPAPILDTSLLEEGNTPEPAEEQSA